MTNAITAAAAVAAAVFSLVNVLLSNRFTRTTQVQQWRRDSMRKTISELIDAVREFTNSYEGACAQIILQEQQSYCVPLQFIRDAESESGLKLATARTQVLHFLGELELIASADCVRAGYRLLESISVEMLQVFHSTDKDSRRDSYNDLMNAVDSAREDFRLACRVDLGVDLRRRLQTRWRFRVRRRADRVET